jgi:hypothetical protein
MLQQATATAPPEDVNADEENTKFEHIAARANFWQYRITMNPQLILRDKWFPRQPPTRSVSSTAL